MDIKTLQTIGLTSGEAKVYITLIKTGNTTTGELIKTSGVSRSKVYDVLERLKQKGFVTEVVKENVRHFEAAHPRRIIDNLQEKKDQLEEDITRSKKIVSELLKLRDSNLTKQEAKVYIGFEGWKTLYKEILEELTPKDEYLAFGIGEEDMKIEKVRLFIRNFHLRRAEKGVRAKILINRTSKDAMSYFADLKKYQYKYLSSAVPSNTAIFRDTVVILVSGTNPVAFAIHSKQVAQKYKTYFNELWKKSKAR